MLARSWRNDMLRAAAEWAADPEVAEYNMRLARLNAKAKAREQARNRK